MRYALRQTGTHLGAKGQVSEDSDDLVDHSCRSNSCSDHEVHSLLAVGVDLIIYREQL